MTTTAAKIKPNDRISYRGGERIERVTRVTKGPRGYVLIRTDYCDRVVKVATPIEVQS